MDFNRPPPPFPPQFRPPPNSWINPNAPPQFPPFQQNQNAPPPSPFPPFPVRPGSFPISGGMGIGFPLVQNPPQFPGVSPFIHFRPNLSLPNPAIFPSTILPGGLVPTPHLALPTRSMAEDKLTTMFVGSISDGVTDDWIEKILKTCGGIKVWKRVLDAYNNPKTFGFVIYEDINSVIRAMEVIETKEIELPSMKKASVGVSRKLKLRIDEQVRTHIAEVKESKEKDSEINEKFKESIVISQKNLSEVIKNINATLADSFLATTISSTENNNSLGEMGIDPNDELPNDLAPEERELLRREITLFRERSAAKDKAKREREEYEIELKRKREERDREKEWEGPSHDDNSRERNSGNDRNRNNLSRRLKDMDDDEEEEKRRSERREREAYDAFKEREKKIESRESARILKYENELRKEEDYERKKESDRYNLFEKYAKWDDDIEQERGEEEFYRDRQRWWSHRYPYIQKENESDSRDRQKRAQELEEYSRKILEQQHQEQHTHNSNHQENGIMESEAVVEENKQEEPNNNNYTRIMTVEERKKNVLELVGVLPADKEGIWAWPVKWNHLQENIIESKLKPFVAKKVIEYLGQEEMELVEFVLNMLRDKKSAETVFSEVEMALDDAETFVKKLWRMLIYETEARSQGLS